MLLQEMSGGERSVVKKPAISVHCEIFSFGFGGMAIKNRLVKKCQVTFDPICIPVGVECVWLHGEDNG